MNLSSSWVDDVQQLSTLNRLMSLVDIHRFANAAVFILFYFILFYFILFHFISFILFYFILSSVKCCLVVLTALPVPLKSHQSRIFAELFTVPE